MKILTLDGGGVRGFLTACILENIEKISTKPISLTKLLQDGTIKVEPHLPKNIQSNVKAVTVSVEVLAHKNN